jgi:hypothetical protein
VRGTDAALRRTDEALRGIAAALRGIDAAVRGSDAALRGSNATLRGCEETSAAATNVHLRFQNADKCEVNIVLSGAHLNFLSDGKS